MICFPLYLQKWEQQPKALIFREIDGKEWLIRKVYIGRDKDTVRGNAITFKGFVDTVTSLRLGHRAGAFLCQKKVRPRNGRG